MLLKWRHQARGQPCRARVTQAKREVLRENSFLWREWEGNDCLNNSLVSYLRLIDIPKPKNAGRVETVPRLITSF